MSNLSEKNIGKIEVIAGIIFLASIIMSIVGLPVAYVVLRRVYGDVLGERLFTPVMFIMIVITLIGITISGALVQIKHEEADKVCKVIAAICIMAVIGTIAFTILTPLFNYVSVVAVELNADITNATLYIQPYDNKLNLTLTFVMHNYSPYPINITGIYIDIGEVCGDIAFVFPLLIPYSHRCYTQLDTPAITIKPNETVFIVAHRIYDKAVLATKYVPVMVTTHRADVKPPDRALKVEQKFTALAKIYSNSDAEIDMGDRFIST